MKRNKKDISNLINGIVGNDPAPLRAEDEQGNIPKETAEALNLSPDLEEKLNAVRRAKVGRPKKYSEEERRERENRATFVVSRDLVRKVKYISLLDSKLLKDIIAEALTSYIEKWEDQHGKINLPKK